MFISRFTTSIARERDIPKALRPHRQDFELQLDALREKTQPKRVARLTAEFADRDRDALCRALEEIKNETARRVIASASEPSWMWALSPPLLQAEIYLGVLRLPKNQTTSEWRMFRFQEDRRRYDEDLHKLFVVQRKIGSELQAFSKHSPLYCPFFTGAENRLIPDFACPIRDLIDRLVEKGLIRRGPPAWPWLRPVVALD